MTTTTASPEVRLDKDPLRILTIAANLLPGEITDARRERKLHGIIAAALVVLLLALIGWDVYARTQTSSASAALTRAESVAAGLQKDQGGFAELNSTKAAEKAITAELTTLMAQDLPWYKYYPALAAALPTGTTIIDLSGTLTPPTTSTAGSATSNGALPGLSSPSAIGNLTIVGDAVDKAHIASYIEALNKIKGVGDVNLSTALIQTGGFYQFNIQLEITSAILGGRYTTTTSSTGGH
jgi:hypothetical protein